MTLILIALAALADRIRGGGYHPGLDTWVGKVSSGLIIAALVSPSTLWLYPACVAAYWIGEAPGWAWRLGDVLFQNGDQSDPRRNQWWTVESSHVSLAIRGAIWGAPFLLIAPWLPAFWLAVPLFAVSMLAAPVIVRQLHLHPNRAWAAQEYLRGAMVAAGFSVIA